LQRQKLTAEDAEDAEVRKADREKEKAAITNNRRQATT
jgi:hypothetical protein